MAVEALFNSSLDALLKRVRIDKAEEPTLTMVYQAISEVRVGFYSALGIDRVNLIRTYPLVDNPTTDNELMRANAANVEALWVTWVLIPRLPYLFMDNRASVGDSWEDEPLTRDASGMFAYLNNLKARIDEALNDLQPVPDDDVGVTKVSSIKAAVPYSAFGIIHGAPGKFGYKWP